MHALPVGFVLVSSCVLVFMDYHTVGFAIYCIFGTGTILLALQDIFGTGTGTIRFLCRKLYLLLFYR
jgi:hypothetical protein